MFPNCSFRFQFLCLFICFFFVFVLFCFFIFFILYSYVTVITIAIADRPVNFTNFRCRISTNQPSGQSVPHLNVGTRVVGIFVPAAPTKRYHPSGSWMSHNTGPDSGVS